MTRRLHRWRAPRAQRTALGKWARLWCALVAMLAFGAELGHWALLSHSVCAAHGEIVHGDEAHAHGHAAAELGDEDERSDTLATSGDDDDDHEHCGAVTHEAHACSVQEPVLAERLAWHPAAWRPVPSHLVATRRFLLAPKTSPPAAS